MLPIEDQLRQYVDALADDLAPTVIDDIASPRPDHWVYEFRPPPDSKRSHRWLIAAAAAVIVVVGAVGISRWVAGGTDGADAVNTSTATTPVVRADGVITDPLHIDLDPWLKGAPPNWSLVNGPYMIFDTSRIPDGWKVLTVSGSEPIVDSTEVPGETGYGFNVELIGPDGNFFALQIGDSGRGLGQTRAAADPVKIRGRDGLLSDGLLAWTEQGGFDALILADSPSGQVRDRMVQLAESLETVMVDTLPLHGLMTHFRPDDTTTTPVLAGTIRGHTWQFGVTDRGTGGEIAVDDYLQSGFTLGLAANFPSTLPSDQSTKTQVKLARSLSGVPGGVIIGGIISDTARIDHLIAETSDGVQIDIPSVHLAELNVVAFAVPVASDLDLILIRFLDDTGTQRYQLPIPKFPRSAVGTSFRGPFPLDGPDIKLFGN